MNSDFSIKLFVFGFLNSDINTDCNTQSFFLNDFMNVLQNFNDLWHDNDLFDDLFKNMRNFNDLFSGAVNWDDLLFESINSLELGFNLISDISFLNEVILFNDFISVDNDFFNFGVKSLNSYDLLFDNWDFNGLLLKDGDFTDSFDD